MIVKAGSSRTAQGFAENYDSFAFRQLGASEAICQNREIGFMPDFFRDFYRIVGQKQRSTRAYRPQFNGTEELMCKC